METQTDLELKALSQFYGTQHYYDVLGVNVTDGVKYVMDNGYSWFVTDSIAVIRGVPKVRAEPFLVVKLKRVGKSEADLIIDDGNENVLHTQHYRYTDAKKDLKLYCEDNVLMLPSER
jgi:hypothetical protein